MSEEAKEGGEKKTKGGNLLQIVNLVLLVLVLAVGGFIAWKMMHMEASPGGETAAEHGASEEAKGPPLIIDMSDITVNLADTDESRFLRAKIKLEVQGEANQLKVNERMVQINDLVITILSGKKFNEIRTPQGKYELKEELVFRINRAIGEKTIANLYFTDFVSQ